MTLTTRCPHCGAQHAAPEAEAAAARDRRTIEAQQNELETLRARASAMEKFKHVIVCTIPDLLEVADEYDIWSRPRDESHYIAFAILREWLHAEREPTP